MRITFCTCTSKNESFNRKIGKIKPVVNKVYTLISLKKRFLLFLITEKLF